jgi:AcrR family transcriptional regulator
MPAKPRKTEKPSAKRAYLSRDLRRQALLEQAAALVEQQGWTALSMSALAEASGTSRQLVYQHFPSLDKLLADTAWYIFNDTLSDTQASIAANPDRLQEAAKAAEAITLDLPPGRGDALWQLIAGTAGASPELDAMRRGFRDLISGVWSVPVRKQLGLNTADSKAYAWMALMAFWGMRQLVRDRVISRAQGVKLFNQFVARVAGA